MPLPGWTAEGDGFARTYAPEIGARVVPTGVATPLPWKGYAAIGKFRTEELFDANPDALMSTLDACIAEARALCQEQPESDAPLGYALAHAAEEATVP